MNISGHAGLTLGVIYGAGYLVDMLSARQYGGDLTAPQGVRSAVAAGFWKGPRVLQQLPIDFRFILLGALLPDIIDKPLGLWLMPEVVNFNARSIGHSLAFNFGLLSIAMLVLLITRSSGPLLLALSSIGHLFLDQMWWWPEKFLWPLYGWSFPPGSTRLDEWIGFQFSGQWLNPAELAGALVLTWFFIQLYRRRTVLKFLRVGAVR